MLDLQQIDLEVKKGGENSRTRLPRFLYQHIDAVNPLSCFTQHRKSKFVIDLCTKRLVTQHAIPFGRHK